MALDDSARTKYYGELASRVGLRTDIVVMRPEENDLLIHEDNVDTLMSKICEGVPDIAISIEQAGSGIAEGERKTATIRRHQGFDRADAGT
jgi:hypothetical protein